jgi:AcrR family transcriptional regulator
VDPALVHHYFGNKEQLFLETVQAPVDPREVLPAVLAGGVDGVGERLVRMFVGVWDSPAGSPAAALLRSAVNNEWTARMLREFLISQILRRLIKDLDLETPDAPLRASLVASQLVGLAMARYIVKVEPIASAPSEQLVTAIGPTLQRYLTGDLE